ncbi:hypothetical protein PAECIP111894_01410 [Paenibacillus pseudetheri]|uniref:Uncharacterized protein n=1 Tax=Paenibacillus pseudetheri TaxID=2897682 RepID=A0ABN8FHT3_9BACL|nr:hypothetical protein PAECIP111894_01410 [Paenibacillus pseudetheri]
MQVITILGEYKVIDGPCAGIRRTSNARGDRRGCRRSMDSGRSVHFSCNAFRQSGRGIRGEEDMKVFSIQS